MSLAKSLLWSLQWSHSSAQSDARQICLVNVVVIHKFMFTLRIKRQFRFGCIIIIYFNGRYSFIKCKSKPRYQDNQLLVRNVHICQPSEFRKPVLSIENQELGQNWEFFGSKIWDFNRQQAIFIFLLTDYNAQCIFSTWVLPIPPLA